MLLKRIALLLFSLAQLALCVEDYYKVSSKRSRARLLSNTRASFWASTAKQTIKP